VNNAAKLCDRVSDLGADCGKILTVIASASARAARKSTRIYTRLPR
jgi:hypothetical protein